MNGGYSSEFRQFGQNVSPKNIGRRSKPPIIHRTLQQRSGVIDVLRGLSIALVLLNHVNMRLFLAKLPYWQGLPEALHDARVWNGQNGVQIFFALSGYLITSTSLRRWGALSSIRVREFYALRFARIAPLLLIIGVMGMAYVFSLSDVALQRMGLDMSVLGLCVCLLVTATASRPYVATERAGAGWVWVWRR